MGVIVHLKTSSPLGTSSIVSSGTVVFSTVPALAPSTSISQVYASASPLSTASELSVIVEGLPISISAGTLIVLLDVKYGLTVAVTGTLALAQPLGAVIET
ncbi:hypothetical protein [Pontibacter mangrovi]|uniref:hypothetical protein n=1 Tax=Pontibacter mangrovi TaxID=2589816 RepID=UPI0015E2F216|nr:hypothetical protein [Pontibacter mangrovi]